MIQFKLPSFTANSIHSNSENSKLTNSFKKISNSIKSINPIKLKTISNSNSSNPINPKGQVNVTTRNRRRHNNFEQQITKRKRAPNRPKDKVAVNKNNMQTIATQKENSSNKGSGRSPIRPDPNNPIFPLSNTRDKPKYRKNLAQVFGEVFLAEATAKDITMAPIIKIIRECEWETLKRTSPHF